MNKDDQIQWWWWWWWWAKKNKKWSFTYNRTSGIHLMAVLCAAAKSSILIKKEKKSAAFLSKAFPHACRVAQQEEKELIVLRINYYANYWSGFKLIFSSMAFAFVGRFRGYYIHQGSNDLHGVCLPICLFVCLLARIHKKLLMESVWKSYEGCICRHERNWLNCGSGSVNLWTISQHCGIRHFSQFCSHPCCWDFREYFTRYVPLVMTNVDWF